MAYTFIFLFVLALICVAIFWQTLQQKRFDKSMLALYTFVAMVIFYGLAVVFGFAQKGNMQNGYLLLQIFMVLIGGLHVWAMFTYIDWSSRKSFLSELCYTLFLSCIGALGFVGFLTLIKSFSVAYIYMRTFLLFPLPFLLVKIFDFWTVIPPMAFKTLKIIKGQAVPIIEEHPNNLVNFQLFKNVVDKQAILVTVPDPLKKHIKLGSYYKYFIFRYNQDYPNAQIEWKYVTDKGEEFYYEWFFYKQNKWWQLRNYLDPDKSMIENQIKATDIIIAERLLKKE